MAYSSTRDTRSKVAGILAEARWSGSTPSWVAVGVGVNVAQPDVAGAAGSARRIVVPAPGSLAADTEPPCATMV